MNEKPYIIGTLKPISFLDDENMSILKHARMARKEYSYRANAYFKGGYILKRVYVYIDSSKAKHCLALSDDGKSVLIFYENLQEKPFRLEKQA